MKLRCLFGFHDYYRSMITTKPYHKATLICTRCMKVRKEVVDTWKARRKYDKELSRKIQEDMERRAAEVERGMKKKRCGMR